MGRLFEDLWRIALVAKLSDYVKDQREYNADQDRSRERKIESRILAAIDNVTRKPANRNVSPAQQNERQPDDDDDPTEQHQQFAQVCHTKSLNHPSIQMSPQRAESARICSHEKPSDIPRTLARRHRAGRAKYIRGRDHR